MDSEFDWYKVDASREELLEEFYQLMVSLDVIDDIEEKLLNDGEMEAWAELHVLEHALQTRAAADTGDDQLKVSNAIDAAWHSGKG